MKLPRNELNGWIVASVPSPGPNSIGTGIANTYYQGWTPCITWCAEQIKDGNWRFVGEGVFEFRRADDHMMFVLRWA